MKNNKRNYLSDFIINKLSQGRCCFTLPELRSLYNVSDQTLQQALQRLIKKDRICSVRRNFYVIIPPEYLAQRILPPALFVNDLMGFLGRPYYSGLLSAASFYGASHQQPQEFFVVTVKPNLRRIHVRGIIINFIMRKKIIPNLIRQQTTQTGYLQVSGPALTALDCIISADRIGGINRAMEIVNDIAPALTKKELQGLMRADVPLPAIQRLGTMLDHFEEWRHYGDTLFNAAHGCVFHQIVLSPSDRKVDGLINRWRVVENIETEGNE